MMDESRTISKRWENDPMIEFLMIEESTVVYSPIATLGPMIEFFTLQPAPILTG
jgi:hypothetical protein